MPIGLILRVLPYVIIIAAIVVGYFYWYDRGYDKGYTDATIVYEERNSKLLIQTSELVAKTRELNAALLERQRNKYMGAIESYAKHIEDINNTAIADAGKRLYVTTKTANTCSNTLPTRKDNTIGSDPRSGGVYQTELAEEITRTIRANAREVAIGAASCQKLLDIVK